jgi:DNA-binding transcriptional LysR family regulator
MEVFFLVVELGGFPAAARAFRMTPSAVSKLVGRFESPLKVRLLNRLTRQIQLSSEGCVFYERSLKVLADLEEAERETATNDAPRGRLCVSTNAPFCEHLTPIHPAGLALHNRLGFNDARAIEEWPLLDQSQTINVATTGNAQVSNGEALRRLTLAGLGLTRLAAFQVKDDIAAGRLQTVLEDFNPGDVEEVHAAFLGQGGYLPSRVRPLLDFLVEKVDLG